MKPKYTKPQVSYQQPNTNVPTETWDDLQASLAAAEKRLLEADGHIVALMEAARHQHEDIDSGAVWYECGGCYASWMGDEKHADDCPVERARQWRKEGR